MCFYFPDRKRELHQIPHEGVGMFMDVMYNMPLHFKFIDTQRYTRDREHVVELVQVILVPEIALHFT